MKNIAEKQKRLRVRVVWRDAVSHAEWLNPADAKKYKPYLNITEGFDTDIGDTCVIPSENVVSICELKINKKYVSKSSIDL